jgi:alpha-L-fucosidase
MQYLWLAAVVMLCISNTISAQNASDDRDARMDWWREARFGLFIHWGIYAIPAGEWKGKTTPSVGEWLMHHMQIPVEEYEPLAQQFDPVEFDAKQWVRIVKDAGMKYIVITSKHHDGFAIFDSAVSDYDVMATPWKRDPLKELAEACEQEGIRLCFYYSILDWHHPDYLPRQTWDKRPAEGADFDRYVTYMKSQLRELLTNYGPIGVLWFDGEWERTWTHERGVELYNYVRQLQPQIIINNRIDKGRAGMEGLDKPGEFVGDFGTPEQQVPATGLPGVDWESCMTMNDSWGYKRADENWKSSKDLIRTLIDIASKGGNFLLNVGPTSEGLIPEPSVERLNAIGRWMSVNGESIHGTSASPLPEVPWGRCTQRGDTLYLHLFDLPDDRKLALPEMKRQIVSVHFLADARKTPVRFTARDGAAVIDLADEAPVELDDAATVLVVTTRPPPAESP